MADEGRRVGKETDRRRREKVEDREEGSKGRKKKIGRDSESG